jgi:hypothetical protein
LRRKIKSSIRFWSRQRRVGGRRSKTEIVDASARFRTCEPPQVAPGNWLGARWGRVWEAPVRDGLAEKYGIVNHCCYLDNARANLYQMTCVILRDGFTTSSTPTRRHDLTPLMRNYAERGEKDRNVRPFPPAPPPTIL